MTHGATPTVFADSENAQEPNVVLTTMYYSWFTVWTAQAGEGIKMQMVREASAPGTTEVRADQITIAAIKLSDDLTEDTGSGGDWKYNEVVNTTSLVTTGDSSSNNATITFTPATASHDWLILSKSRITGTSATNSTGSRIVRSGEASTTTPFCQHQGEDATNDMQVYMLGRVDTLGNASNTYEEKGFALGSNNGTRQSSGIFALDLNKLRNHAFSYADNSVTDLNANALNASPTQVASASITPDVTGDSWVYGFCTIDINGTNAGFIRARLQVDNVDQPGTQTSDNYLATDAWGTTDELEFNIQSIESLSSGSAHPVDLDASVETATAGRGARAKLVFAVTMELPAAVNAITKVVTENVTVSEAVSAVVTHNVVKVPTADSATVSEATAALRTMNRASADTTNITEATAKAQILVRQVAETVNATDAESLLESKTRAESADFISLSDAVSRNLGLVRIFPNPDYSPADFVPDDFAADKEVIGISESVATVIQTALTKAFGDSASISESVLRLSGVVRESTDNVTVSEGINWLESLTRVPTADSVVVSESALATRAILQIASDSVTISESASRLTAILRTVATDTTNITEAVSANLTLSRTLTDNVAISESLTALKSKVKVLDEAVTTVTEAVNYVTAEVANQYVKFSEDSITVSDPAQVVVLINQIVKAVGDSVEIAEALDKTVSALRYSNDSVAVSESVTKALSLIRTALAETVEISELTSRLSALARLDSSDNAQVSENIVRVSGLAREDSADSLTITEEILQKLQAEQVHVVTDSLAISESAEAVMMGPPPQAPLSPTLLHPIRRRKAGYVSKVSRPQLEPTPELKTKVVSRRRFVYSIASGPLAVEHDQIKLQLEALALKDKEILTGKVEPLLLPESKKEQKPKAKVAGGGEEERSSVSDATLVEPEDHEAVPPLPPAADLSSSQSVVVPTALSSNPEKQTQKQKLYASLKIPYKIKSALQYNKLLKMARLLKVADETLEILDEI